VRRHGLQLGDRLRQLLLADAPAEVLEALARLPVRHVARRDPVHDLRDPLRRDRSDREAERPGVVLPLPAEHDLEVRHGVAADLAAVAEESDVGDMVLAAGVEAPADLDAQAADRLVELVRRRGEPLAQLAGESARRRDAELAGVGSRAGGDVQDRPGAGLAEPDLDQRVVQGGQIGLADPAEHDVLLDREPHRVADEPARDVGELPSATRRGRPAAARPSP